jgi:soluble lytic murein transglycosylase
MCGVCLRAGTLETVASAYRKNPTPASRAALVQFANAHPKDRDGALALLALGATELEKNQFADAARHLESARPRLTSLDDYSAFLRGSALAKLNRPGEALALFETVWKASPASPLTGQAALLASKCLLELHQPARALETIDAHRSEISDPSAELARAEALEALGRIGEAAGRYQWVWSEYPQSSEAAAAESALVRLRGHAAYPKETSELLLTRAGKLVDGRDYLRAAKELQGSMPRMVAADQERARVLLGAIRYRRRDAGACDYLRSLRLTDPDADAERLYYVVISAIRARRYSEAGDALERLERWHPKSSWRLQALLAMAGRYALDGQPAAAQPLYRACYESFPQDPQAAGCHWRFVWQGYRDAHAGARDALLEHLRRFPDSEHAPAALYFLGRIAQNNRDFAAARAYYQEIDALFPNQYYTGLARQRLRESGVSSAGPSATVTAQLGGLHLSDHRGKADLTATPATQARLDRAGLLTEAALYDLAEEELRFAGRNAAQPQVIALALAELADHEQEPERGIRFIRHYAPGYLGLPVNNVTEPLWKLAFPIPFRDALEKNARLSALDPFLVAGLIRQESEFNPHAISRARALGLAQIMPGTGRLLSRKINIRGFRTAMLYVPDVNLRIGTFYLRLLLDELQGQWEETLASYNAGKARVVAWLTGAQYAEPAEFVESIPIPETRDYVQNVMRNADVYRMLYGGK